MEDKNKYHYWFRTGQKAKQKGFSKVSPFYENLTAEYFFNCGYDGTSFEEAKSFLQEKLKELLEQNPVVVESINTIVEQSKPLCSSCGCRHVIYEVCPYQERPIWSLRE